MADKLIKSVPFDGKEGSFGMWRARFMAWMQLKGLYEVMIGAEPEAVTREVAAVSKGKDVALLQPPQGSFRWQMTAAERE